ncbi:STAS-like domain-containing protein [Polaribacter atrinae]|uniref:STAS-like domain-containing protein n=1 Tax=Polaribacter atrinae TaxID=1333662 RepID=UPI00249070D7|nr:STAS-like domain-containing protein [Polaribacter atrinae]
MQILIKDIISKSFAVSTEDGDKIFSILNENFINKEKVALDFKGITLMTTAFLNAAIGQLYSNNKYSSIFLNESLILQNVEDQDKHLFKLVVNRAKEYFANKKEFEKNSDDTIYGGN